MPDFCINGPFSESEAREVIDALEEDPDNRALVMLVKEKAPTALCVDLDESDEGDEWCTIKLRDATLHPTDLSPSYTARFANGAFSLTKDKEKLSMRSAAFVPDPRPKNAIYPRAVEFGKVMMTLEIRVRLSVDNIVVVTGVFCVVTVLTGYYLYTTAHHVTVVSAGSGESISNPFTVLREFDEVDAVDTNTIAPMFEVRTNVSTLLPTSSKKDAMDDTTWSSFVRCAPKQTYYGSGGGKSAAKSIFKSLILDDGSPVETVTIDVLGVRRLRGIPEIFAAKTSGTFTTVTNEKVIVEVGVERVDITLPGGERLFASFDYEGPPFFFKGRFVFDFRKDRVRASRAKAKAPVVTAAVVPKFPEEALLAKIVRCQRELTDLQEDLQAAMQAGGAPATSVTRKRKPTSTATADAVTANTVHYASTAQVYAKRFKDVHSRMDVGDMTIVYVKLVSGEFFGSLVKEAVGLRLYPANAADVPRNVLPEDVVAFDTLRVGTPSATGGAVTYTFNQNRNGVEGNSLVAFTHGLPGLRPANHVSYAYATTAVRTTINGLRATDRVALDFEVRRASVLGPPSDESDVRFRGVFRGLVVSSDSFCFQPAVDFAAVAEYVRRGVTRPKAVLAKINANLPRSEWKTQRPALEMCAHFTGVVRVEPGGVVVCETDKAHEKGIAEDIAKRENNHPHHDVLLIRKSVQGAAACVVYIREARVLSPAEVPVDLSSELTEEMYALKAEVEEFRHN